MVILLKFTCLLFFKVVIQFPSVLKCMQWLVLLLSNCTCALNYWVLICFIYRSLFSSCSSRKEIGLCCRQSRPKGTDECHCKSGEKGGIVILRKELKKDKNQSYDDHINHRQKCYEKEDNNFRRTAKEKKKRNYSHDCSRNREDDIHKVEDYRPKLMKKYAGIPNFIKVDQFFINMFLRGTLPIIPTTPARKLQV